MLQKIINFSINHKLIIGLMTCFLVFYGAYETFKLPIDAVPDITNNQVQIITVAPSFGATDIERLVTFPIEQTNSNIDGIKEIRSFSRFGLSLVTLVFEDEVDIYWARQQVAERLQQIQNQIPTQIGTPTLGPISTGLGEIYQYILKPIKGFEHQFDITQLRTLQDWVVRRQLLGLKGVAEVSSFGGKLKQYEITIDPNKLHSYQVNLNEIFAALENNNQNTGGAYIEKNSTSLFIRSEGLINSLEDLEQISIKSLTNGHPIFLKDIAEIKIGYATRYGALCYNDEGEVAGGVVMMLKGANSSEVIKTVKQRIDLIQKTLPKGVQIEAFLDRTKMVNHAISTVEQNLLEGALIVVFVLVLFLGNFRAGLLVASVIPLAMLFAIIMMNTFGVSGNLMSLGALDFGLIIDGAVIIVEAIMHQLAHDNKFKNLSKIPQKQMDSEVGYAANKMMNSAVFGQVIILMVYLPIFTLQGIEGKMFKPMAQTVAFALLGAFILSLTYIPMMSTLVLSKKIKHQPNLSDKIMNFIEFYYQILLQKALKIPKLILSCIFILFLISVFVVTRLGGEFIPALEEGDFAVETRILTGSNLTTTIESTQKAAHILKSKFPEIEKIVTKIGSGEVPTDPMPMDAADMMLIMKDKKEWVNAHSFNEMKQKMQEALTELPGVTFGFQYPVQMRFNELMTGAKQEVVCKIFGENLDTLALYANKLGAVINKVKGSQNLYIEPVSGVPQIVIYYKRNLVAQYHLNISEINKIVNVAFAGQVAGQVFEGEKKFDLILRLAGAKRTDLEDVTNLLIPTPDGTQIPLYLLADVSIVNGPNQIQREDSKRRIMVGFNILNRDVESLVQELQTQVNQKIKLPTGYYITYGGSFENLNAAKNRLMIAVPASLILIFILLFFAFNSVKQGMLIYTAIPLSAIGGILFLALREMPFSISAGVGFIALFGVAVLNGIVLISEFNALKKQGITDLNTIIIQGTKMRLRPVLMTACVASLGFLPMALSNGAGAEVQRPLATVVIGGLMIATFLTLFMLPILYIIFENINGLKIKFNKKLLSSFLLIISVIASNQAQQSISLEESIHRSLKNNLTLKNQQLKNAYQEQLIQTSYNIPETSISTELGQNNSIYFDSKFGIAQSVNLPVVYRKQKEILKKEWQNSIFMTSLKENELKKSVRQIFYEFNYLKKKELLLKENQRLYEDFLQKTVLKFSKGDTDILEKTTAEIQKETIDNQIIKLDKDLKLLVLEFQLLINDIEVIPELLDQNIIEFNPLLKPLEEHPFLKLMQGEYELSKALTSYEKSKLLPAVNFGVFNSSMKGTGADDKYYEASSRFTNVQVGLQLPIFNSGQKNLIKAYKTKETIAENNYQITTKELEFSIKKNTIEVEQYQKIVFNLEQKLLPHVKIIRENANKKLNTGEINFLDWVGLINQSIQLENNYLEEIRTLNESIIQNYYLHNQ